MAHVKVGTDLPTKTVVVAGTPTSIFTFNFAYISPSDVRVLNNGTLVSSSLYTLIGNAVDRGYEGGTVTLNTAVTNATIEIQRLTTRSRNTDFPTSGEFDIDGLNTEFDAWRMIAQEIDNNLVDINIVVDALPQRVKKTPYDYGATHGQEMSEDNWPFVQALMNAWTSSWSQTAQGFLISPSFGGAMFRCDSEVFLNETRQPNGTIFGDGGGIFSRATNGVALNALGTNELAIKDLQIYGDPLNPPDIGIAYGFSNTSGISPGMNLVNVITRGHFNKASGVNFCSETGGHYDCYFENRSPIRSARSFYWAQSNESIDADCTGGSATIQGSFDVGGNSTALTTRQSFLGHTLLRSSYKRTSTVSLVITGITKSNPAVVTVATGTLAGAGWTNGTEVSLHSVTGMTEIEAGIHTIQNINTGADTFELVGVDSTAYSTFTAGRAWQATGPAITNAGAALFSMHDCYLLSYSEVNHTINMANANPVRSFYMRAQCEASNDHMCEIVGPSSPSTAIIQGGFHWENMNSSQKVGVSFFKMTGTGKVRIDGGRIRIANLPSPYPTDGLFDDPSNLLLRDFKIEVPLSSILNANDEYDVYDVEETAFDRDPRRVNYRAVNDYSVPNFIVEDGRQITARFQSNDTTASVVDDVAPIVDLYRNNESALSAATVGKIRFLANNDATQSTLAVTSISQANPAVVTVDSGELSAAGWANGYVVLFAALNGMDQLQDGGFTVQNINVGAGTFELAGVDSTTYPAFVSGNVLNRVRAPYAGVSGYAEDDTAYAEYGRLLFQAIVDGAETTVGYINQHGMTIFGRRVVTNQQITTAELEDIADAVNTTDKFAGKVFYNSNTNRYVHAIGATAASVWTYFDGTTAHTPV